MIAISIDGFDFNSKDITDWFKEFSGHYNPFTGNFYVWDTTDAMAFILKFGGTIVT